MATPMLSLQLFSADGGRGFAPRRQSHPRLHAGIGPASGIQEFTPVFPPHVLRKSWFFSLTSATLFLATLSGCQHNAASGTATAAAAGADGTFATRQFALLPVGDNKPTDIYLRDTLLFVYTQQHVVYVLDRNSLEVKWVAKVPEEGSYIRPPVVLPNFVVLPTIGSLEIYDRYGRGHQSYPTHGLALHSGAVGFQTRVYFGGDAVGGGRIVCVDLNGSQYQKNSVAWELATRGGISAAPAVQDGLLYVGDDNGDVYAVNAFTRDAMWPMKEEGKEEHVFSVAGAIRADIKADHDGVYIASMDTKLYCLNPKTGKIKWQFYAGEPLVSSPELSPTSVYQYLEGVGLIAMDRNKGDAVRKARWTFPTAVRFLTEDAKYAYLQQQDHSVVAVDLATGKPKFASRRKDYAAFAFVSKGDVIYSVSDDGVVRAAAPRTDAMNFGEMAALQDFDMQPIAAR